MTDNRKVAKIVSEPLGCTDDGRALGLRWMLFLNDNEGRGFWHGGPGRPNHGRVCNSEEEARARAAELGYNVIGVAWT